jgi:PAS domain S-box-containing protein
MGIERQTRERINSDDELLLGVLRATAPHTGDPFFRAVSLSLANVAHARASFVCELLLSAEAARVFAGATDGEPAEPLEYALPSTPCAEVVSKGMAIYPDSVSRRFPEDEWLRNINAQSYAGVLLRSSSGDPIGMLGVAHDGPIEADVVLRLLQGLAPRVAAELERRQIENALRRSETRMRLLVERSKDIMFYYQVLPTGSFEYVSPAAGEILGLPPEALQGNPDLGIELLHEDDRPLVMRAISSGSEEPITARIHRADGELRWVEYSNFAFRDAESQLVGIGGCIRDISPRFRVQEELKNAQSYTRALLEDLPDTVLRLDVNGTILDFVPGEAFDQAFETGNVIGTDVKDFLPSAFALPARRLLQAALRTGRHQRSEFEATVRGELHYYEARCVPFGEEEALLILRDFTAVKWHEGEEERRRLRDELDNRIERRIRANPYGLTYRELAILHLVADGSADKQIAESLGISIYTVNKHVGNILGKMNASSRTEAGVRAIREGLLG